MSNTFTIPAGKRQRVLWIFSSSIPGEVRFTATPVNGRDLSGKIELSRGRWFQSRTEKHRLLPRNVFDKGFADANYSIHVTPDQDCTITFETSHFRAGTLLVILAVVVGLGLAAGLPAFILGAS